MASAAFASVANVMDPFPSHSSYFEYAALLMGNESFYPVIWKWVQSCLIFLSTIVR